MSMKAYELEKKFKEEFPIDLLGDVVRAIAISYETSYDYVYSNFRAPIARNLLPYHRWTSIDNNLLAVAENHGIQTAINKNAAKNCSHVKYLSKYFIVTANATNYPSQAIRDAKYRSAYAEANYPFLYPEMEPKLTPPYYATFLHGWYYPELSKPGYIYVGFPLHDSPGYVTEPFNLAAYCDVEELIAEIREDVFIQFKDEEDN
jgi:hypothetical protein